MKKRKFLSVLLVLMMLMSYVPSAYANPSETEVVKDNEVSEITENTNKNTPTVTDGIISQGLKLDAYSNNKLDVYKNSRVTSIKFDDVKKTITLEGYAFIQNRNFDRSNSLWREVILVNADDTSVDYAYREQVTSIKKGQFLTSNKNLNPNAVYNYDYAMYTVTFDLNNMKKYDNRTYEKVKGGDYLIYVRVSDGINSKLFPLQNVTLNDGSKTELPSMFAEASDSIDIALKVDGERAVEKVEEIKPSEPDDKEENTGKDEYKPTRPHRPGNGGGSSGGSNGGSEEKPEEPEKPTDPEKPVDPEEPTEPENPVDPSEPGETLQNFDFTENQFIEIETDIKDTTQIYEHIIAMNSEDKEVPYHIDASEVNGIYTISFLKNEVNEGGIFKLVINSDKVKFIENEKATKYYLSWKVEKAESSTVLTENTILLSHDEEFKLINTRSTAILNTTDTELREGQKVTFYNKDTKMPEAYIVDSCSTPNSCAVDTIPMEEAVDTINAKGHYYPDYDDLIENFNLDEITNKIVEEFSQEYPDIDKLEVGIEQGISCNPFAEHGIACKISLPTLSTSSAELEIEIDLIINDLNTDMNFDSVNVNNILNENFWLKINTDITSEVTFTIRSKLEFEGSKSQDKILEDFLNEKLSKENDKHTITIFTVPIYIPGTPLGVDIDVNSKYSLELSGEGSASIKGDIKKVNGFSYTDKKIDIIDDRTDDITDLNLQLKSGVTARAGLEAKVTVGVPNFAGIGIGIEAGVYGKAEAYVKVNIDRIIQDNEKLPMEGYGNLEIGVYVDGSLFVEVPGPFDFELIGGDPLDIPILAKFEFGTANLPLVKQEDIIATKSIIPLPVIEYYAFVEEESFKTQAPLEKITFDYPEGVSIQQNYESQTGNIIIDKNAPKEFDIGITYRVPALLDGKNYLEFKTNLHVINKIDENNLHLTYKDAGKNLINFTWNGELFNTGVYALWGWKKDGISEIFGSPNAIINQQFDLNTNSFVWDTSKVEDGTYTILLAHADSIENINLSTDTYDIDITVNNAEISTGKFKLVAQELDKNVIINWDGNAFETGTIGLWAWEKTNENIENGFMDETNVLDRTYGAEFGTDTFSWDISNVKNGTYIIKIAHTDTSINFDNPTAYETVEVVITNGIDETDDPNLDEEGNIIWIDKNIEYMAHEMLQIPQDQKLKPEQVAEITEIGIYDNVGNSTIDLSDLKYFTGLRKINTFNSMNVNLVNFDVLSELNITDANIWVESNVEANEVEALKLLTKLENLQLVFRSNSYDEDISFLNDLPNLKNLYLETSDRSTVNDLSIPELSNSSIVNLGLKVVGNIQNISNLGTLPNLKYLHIFDNGNVGQNFTWTWGDFVNVDSGYPSLEVLSIGKLGNEYYDLSELDKINELKVIHLSSVPNIDDNLANENWYRYEKTTSFGSETFIYKCDMMQTINEVEVGENGNITIFPPTNDINYEYLLSTTPNLSEATENWSTNNTFNKSIGSYYAYARYTEKQISIINQSMPVITWITAPYEVIVQSKETVEEKIEEAIQEN